MRIRGLRASLVSLPTILLIMACIGCGSGSSAQHGTPETSVTSTQNPLVAQYNVILFGPATVWAEFGTDTSYGRQTSSTPTTGPVLSSSAAILIAGMKPATTYHIRAHVDWPDGTSWVDQDQTFTTGSLPPINTVSLTVTRPTQAPTTATAPQKGVELLNLVDTGTVALQNAVTDLDGNLIWYYNANIGAGESALPVKPLSNGHLITIVGNPTPGQASAEYHVREIDLAGNTIRDVTSTQLDQMLQSLGHTVTISQLHHDVLPLPNGHTILLGNIVVPYTDLPGYPGTTKVIGDILIDLDPNWTPVWFWSSFDHLDVNRHNSFGLPDWTHSNAVLYTSNDGNLLLSIRAQSWIVKIDYANGAGSGNILWRLGEGGDFAITGGDPSQWFYAQHFPDILNINGSQLTLAVFDNGNFRVVDSSGTECGLAIACYSRAAIFNVDESARVATLDWDDTPGFYSFWGGSIGVVDNGNVEFDMTAPYNNPITFTFESKSQVMEVTQDSNPTVVWQMDIDGASAYRAYRIPSLYPGVSW
jgi:arylsulfate sulfotransferase